MQTHLEPVEVRVRSRGRRLLSYEDLRERGIPYSKVQLWRMARDGTFPSPVKPSHSRIAWVEDEVNEWVEQLVAHRNAEVDHG